MLAVATALALAGCTSHQATAPSISASAPASDSVSPSSPPAVTPSASATTTAPVYGRSLSGLAGTAGKPVIAIKIDNTPPARPQTGVNSADIVYLEDVEGGATRFMAVFQSTLPTLVGPIRSGRITDIEILAAYGRVALVYSGAQPRVESAIRAAPLRPFAEGEAPGFIRTTDRYAPYNLYLDPQKLLAAHHELPTANGIGLLFGPAGSATTPATAASVVMTPNETYGFAFDAASSHWLVSVDGRALRQSNGDRLSATNVLVQQVRVTGSAFHDVLGNVTPRTYTVGSGTFRLLRPDGTVTTGTWKRPKASGPTTYTDASGAPATFAPGRTWIVLAPKGNKVTVK
jgi:hypothetical protein